MKKINTYTFNIYWFLIFLSLIGCGNTLSLSGNELKVFNGDSTLLISEEFKLTRLQKAADFDGLPMEFQRYKHEISQFDFYLAQSPTQNSGGFIFEVVETSNTLVVCLKKPDPLTSVTAAMSNPIALIRTRKGINVELKINNCVR
ncbi:hypothetical protein ICV32_04295 [Polynucleobacter sp. MWH-UH24A]|uniref:hypothetical protein n=1 Tax=Polynucleobacter sp. MWH-UH24A TaxID=2689110 RepID=UPI001BFDFBB2|nr:hypothetical protein [Polynucleobacter sp. MWH-UH24A]QWD76877.1 hypothetical protein ICV32_04295 [Polynucleobacter sp. MWH-UH24A]